jgi:uncharacterized membrane protein YbhN (UPF0104 family)
MVEKAKKRWENALKLIAVVLIFSYLTSRLDLESIKGILQKTDIYRLMPLLSLTLISLSLRTMRWKVLLGENAKGIGDWGLFKIFTIGQAASIVTPGKLGDAIRPHLLKRHTGRRRRDTAATVLLDRLTDFMFLFLVSLSGISLLGYPKEVFFAIFIFSLVGIHIFFTKDFHLGKGRLSEIYQNLKKLYLSIPFFISLFFTVLIYLSEFLRLSLVFKALGFPVPFLESSFSMAFSVIVGVLTFLPGGAGTLEATFISVMSVFGKNPEMVFSAVLIERFLNVVFTLVLGSVFYACENR